MRSHTNYGRYLSTVIEFAGTHTDPEIGDICNGVSATVISGIRRKHLKDTGVLIPTKALEPVTPPPKTLATELWITKAAI
jgi:hypothetical protein